jgi:hypothetical protein
MMRLAILYSVCLIAAALGATQAAAQVSPAMMGPVAVMPAGVPAAQTMPPDVRVAFVQPEHYTDANLYGGYGEKALEPALREIRQDLQHLGARYLQPGEVLSIEILDVDLAGRFEPWRALAQDVRFMREVTWPRIKLRYVLQSGMHPPLSAEEEVSDQTYLLNAAVLGRSTQVMPYEKAMLENWFRARFGHPHS